MGFRSLTAAFAEGCGPTRDRVFNGGPQIARTSSPKPVRMNVTLARLRDELTGVCGWLRRDKETAVAEDWVTRLGIRCSSVEQRAGNLSGGNQQKVILARWLYRDCSVLICDEPTRGIDVGAKFEIYRLLDQLAGTGKGIVVVSSDLKELLGLCDRIAVLSAGRLVKFSIGGNGRKI